LLAAAAAFVGLQLYVHAYHRSPWKAVPAQLSACGRDYIYPQAQPRSLAAVTKTDGTPIHDVGSTSGWVRTRAIWGHRAAEGSGDGCGTQVWLRVGSDRFVEYSLSGGI